MREIVVDKVRRPSIFISDLHPVGKIAVLMTDIGRVLFFEDMPFFVGLVLLQNLIADLFSQRSSELIL